MADWITRDEPAGSALLLEPEAIRAASRWLGDTRPSDVDVVIDGVLEIARGM